MKSKKTLTALLVAAMISIPIRADEPPPDKDMVMMACAILAIGIVVVIGLNYICKKIPPPPGTCPCGCGVLNCSCSGSSPGLVQLVPPIGPILTNPPATSTALAKLEYDGFTPFGAGSMADDQGNTWNYNNAFSFSLQSSVDLTNWNYALTVNGWLTTDSGILVSVRSNGVTLANAYFSDARNPANALPLDLPNGPKRFYRIACQ